MVLYWFLSRFRGTRRFRIGFCTVWASGPGGTMVLYWFLYRFRGTRRFRSGFCTVWASGPGTRRFRVGFCSVSEAPGDFVLVFVPFGRPALAEPWFCIGFCIVSEAP